MENWRLLWTTAIQVLSTKLMPEHFPKQADLRNIARATKQQGIPYPELAYFSISG